MINKPLQSFIKHHKLVEPKSTVIIGFSGGPDSVFLLHMLATLQQDFQISLVAAHLNHGWRAEAPQDAEFCKEMAHERGIPFVQAHASEFAEIRAAGSPEEHGRRLRRAFFEKVAASYPEPRIALAHHQNDQIETFFIRLMRGSGLEGLQGIKPRHGKYIRPLLCITKEEILSSLEVQGIPYLTDSTNMQTKYLRNRIRQTALPALSNCDPRFSQSLLRTMEHIGEAEDFIQKTVREIFANISRIEDGTLWISLHNFFTLHPFLQKRILLHWICMAKVPFTPSEGLFDEILRFLITPRGGKHIMYGQWALVKHQNSTTINKS